jgi:G3E family GTPase
LFAKNKWEFVSDRELDIVLDHLHTLNDLTPKVRVSREKGVDPTFIFGLDTKLFSGLDNEYERSLVGDHNEEVQTMTVYKGLSESKPWHLHEHGHGCGCTIIPAGTLMSEVDSHGLEQEVLLDALKSLPSESIWRVKGFVRFSSGETNILNWAFGRHDLTSYIVDEQQELPTVKLTVMGQRGEMKRFAQKFANKLGAELSI